MPYVDAVEIVGLRQFRAALRGLDAAAPRQLRIAQNQAADTVVQGARSRMPSRSGRARASVKAASSQGATRIKEGGARAPYVPWLDYGGAVGPDRSVKRPFIADGRYVYPAYRAAKPEFEAMLRETLQRIADEAGVELD